MTSGDSRVGLLTKSPKDGQQTAHPATVAVNNRMLPSTPSTAPRTALTIVFVSGVVATIHKTK